MTGRSPVNSEKTFGLTITEGNYPLLWSNSSVASTWAALAGNVALFLGGIILSQKIIGGKELIIWCPNNWSI